MNKETLKRLQKLESTIQPIEEQDPIALEAIALQTKYYETKNRIDYIPFNEQMEQIKLVEGFSDEAKQWLIDVLVKFEGSC